MWNCLICRKTNADDLADKCSRCGTPRSISFKSMQELGEGRLDRFDIKGLIQDLKKLCREKKLHPDTVRYYSDCQSLLERFWKEYAGLDILVRRGEFDAADAVLRRWEKEMPGEGIRRKLAEKRLEIEAGKLAILEKTRRERRVNRLLLLGLYGGAAAFFLLFPYLRLKGMELDARKMVRDGRLAEAVRVYELLWEKTGNDNFRRKGSATWGQLRKRREKAEKLYLQASDRFKSYDLPGAAASVDEAIALAGRSEYLELKRRIEEGLLTEAIGNRKEDSLKRGRNMPAVESKAFPRVEANRKGYLLGWARNKTRMILVPEGEFTPYATEANGIVHVSAPVYLNDFWIGVECVTNAQFASFATTMPAELGRWNSGNDPQAPAVNVSWDMADAYCEWLTRVAGLDPRGSLRFRLPTEAQWEKASGLDRVGQVILMQAEAGFAGPLDRDVLNAFGVAGMLDGVEEWCHDLYDPSYYGRRERKNPPGPLKGNYTEMVVRGGFVAGENGVPSRFVRGHASMATGFSNPAIGFRVSFWKN